MYLALAEGVLTRESVGNEVTERCEGGQSEERYASGTWH